jgi:hypothetical protein
MIAYHVVAQVNNRHIGCCCCCCCCPNTAGPGQLLAQQWCSNPRNLLLLPEQGPLTATWLQQCLQQQLLPPLQLQQLQVQYMPVCSTAGAAAAAAAVGHTPEACLTARQLLQLLLQQQQQLGLGQKRREAKSICKVLLSAADRQLLEMTLQADG